MAITDRDPSGPQSAVSERRGWLRRHPAVVGIGSAAATAVVAATIWNVQTARSINEAITGLDDPGAVTGAVTPGEAQPGVEAVNGVPLTAAEVDVFQSGNRDQMNEIIDAELYGRLSDALAAYADGRTDTVDISGISDDPKVQETLEGLVDTAASKAGQEVGSGEFTTWICPSTPSPDYNGMCATEATQWNVGSPDSGRETTSIPIQIVTMGGLAGESGGGRYIFDNAPFIAAVSGGMLQVASSPE